MAVYPERRGGRLSGCWIAEVTQHGERRRKRFDSKRDAERWADFTKVTGAPPVETTPDQAVRTFAATARECLTTNPAWVGARDHSREQRVLFAVEAWTDMPLAAVDTVAFDKLVATLKRRKLGPGTINRYLSCASAVLTYARKRQYIASTPVIPWQTEAGRRVHWLTEDQEEALAAAMLADGREAEALTMRVLARTGMRWGEFEGLVPAQIVNGWVKLDLTKTNTPRDIPLEPDLCAKLAAMLRAGASPNHQQMRRVLKAALETAGQSNEICIHSLRHTTATRLVHGKVNLAVVQKFLGHKDIKTTLKYTHVAPDDLQEAAKKLSPHAGQTPPNAPSDPQ